MSKALSIVEMNNGGVVEAVDAALELLAENIADVNTPPDKLRELTLKIKIKPDQNRTFGNAQIVVSVKTQPQEAQVVSLIMDKVNGKPALFEAYTDHNPDQHRIEGTMPTDIREPKAKSVTPFKAAQA